MNLLTLWEKIGNQNLKYSKKQPAYVFVDDKKIEITEVIYKNGKIIGFNTRGNKFWQDEEIKPKENEWVVVRDKEGKEHFNHQWVGHAWYYFVINEDGTCDGWRTDVEIINWRYQTKEETK